MYSSSLYQRTVFLYYVCNEVLNIPLYFQVSNYGCGCGCDKRCTVSTGPSRRCSSVHCSHPLQWSNPVTEQPGSAELYSPQEQHHLCSECLQTLKNTSVHASITSSVPEITWISPPRCRVQEDLTVNSTFEPLTTVSVARMCC